MKVVPLRTDGEFWSLTPGKEYVVIGLDHDSYRVIDDIEEPILLPKIGFKVVDDTIPENWIWNRFSDDEYYADPPGLHERGFYEAYFDGKPEARKMFSEAMRSFNIHFHDLTAEEKWNKVKLYREEENAKKE